MTPEHKKKFNTVAGTLFIVMGMLGYAMALYYALTPNTPVSPPGEIAQVSDSSCLAVAAHLGFEAHEEPNGLVIKGQLPIGGEVTKDTIQALFANADLVPSLCERKMQYFCIGADCKNGPGLEMRLPALTKRAPSPAEPKKLGSAIKPGTTR
jgi:hypothetical protein